MQYLLDTGILIRLLNRQAPEHGTIRRSVRMLKAQGHAATTTFQNISEFWNVCTRPLEARGGLGLTVEETQRRVRTIERITALLPDSPETFLRWKRLVADFEVKGVQVHDAKLVAAMGIHGVSRILTLNPHDFSRYPTVTAVTPDQVLAIQPS